MTSAPSARTPSPLTISPRAGNGSHQYGNCRVLHDHAYRMTMHQVADLVREDSNHFIIIVAGFHQFISDNNNSRGQGEGIGANFIAMSENHAIGAVVINLLFH